MACVLPVGIYKTTPYTGRSKQMNMPIQKPGRSEQTVCTPPEFLAAIVRRFRADFTWDLAALAINSVAPNFITPEQNSLITDWPSGSQDLWLNPPYSNIEPWVKKCNEHCAGLAWGGRIFVLVPASIGSNWWRNHVWQCARQWILRPRLTFVGHGNPYPKDLALLIYNKDRPDVEDGDYCYFDWKHT